MLHVKSVEETYRFYTNVLGFLPGSVFPGPDGKWHHAGVSFGAVGLMFGPIDQATMDPAFSKTSYFDLTKKGAVGGGINLYLNIGMGSIDQYHRAVRERGAKPITELDTKWWGDRVFSIADPDGYVITFAETVAEFDPNKMPKR
jgi:uncharacterized glyoxalase superfamily protein PhnB